MSHPASVDAQPRERALCPLLNLALKTVRVKKTAALQVRFEHASRRRLALGEVVLVPRRALARSAGFEGIGSVSVGGPHEALMAVAPRCAPDGPNGPKLLRRRSAARLVTDYRLFGRTSTPAFSFAKPRQVPRSDCFEGA